MGRTIGFIGDIHGKFNIYTELIYKYNATIQVGDFGFLKIWKSLLDSNINPHNHKIIPGNHEDYDYILNNNPEHALSTYGMVNFHDLDFFYIRGAHSIDENSRIIGYDLWSDEELSYSNLFNAINDYENNLPNIVVTHTLPSNIINRIFPEMRLIPSKTGSTLDQLFDIYQPKLWITGHFHPITPKIKEIMGTTFVILPSYTGVQYRTDLTIDDNILKWKSLYGHNIFGD